MDGKILDVIKNISLESLYIACCVFLLTMLIKWPIKKFTSKLTEDKRKAVNTIILVIPIVISFLISILYFGIYKSIWFNLDVLEISISSWVVSLTIYAIYERIVILIKGIRTGKLNYNSEITKDTLAFLKKNIKLLISKIKIDKKQFDKIKNQMKSLLEIKSIIESDISNNDIAKLSQTNIQIQELKNEEISLQKQIDENEKQKQIYINKLYNKQGEIYGI